MPGNEAAALDPRLLEILSRPAPEAAPDLLGALITSVAPEGRVTVRLTEVEAYGGPHDSDLPDPGAHTYRGRTARNASMFGPPGHAYVYFTYGMHHALNLVCHPEGGVGGCLLRAGEVVEGVELAARRRLARRRTAPPRVELARGPGNLAQALGLDLSDDAAALHGPVPGETEVHGRILCLEAGEPPRQISASARTGVAGEGGSDRFPWRFAAQGDPTVSAYRAATSRRRAASTMDG